MSRRTPRLQEPQLAGPERGVRASRLADDPVRYRPGPGGRARALHRRQPDDGGEEDRKTVRYDRFPDERDPDLSDDEGPLRKGAPPDRWIDLKTAGEAAPKT